MRSFFISFERHLAACNDHGAVAFANAAAAGHQSVVVLQVGVAWKEMAVTS